MNKESDKITGGGNAPRFKYEIGQTVKRYEKKVKIVDREISPLGFKVYQVKEVYKGNIETTSAREDELRPSNASQNTRKEAELDAAFDNYEGCPTAGEDLAKHGLTREGKGNAPRKIMIGKSFLSQGPSAKEQREAMEARLRASAPETRALDAMQAFAAGVQSKLADAQYELKRVRQERDELLAMLKAIEHAQQLGIEPELTTHRRDSIKAAIAKAEGRDEGCPKIARKLQKELR